MLQKHAADYSRTYIRGKVLCTTTGNANLKVALNQVTLQYKNLTRHQRANLVVILGAGLSKQTTYEMLSSLKKGWLVHALMHQPIRRSAG
jgi:hypothetical protein